MKKIKNNYTLIFTLLFLISFFVAQKVQAISCIANDGYACPTGCYCKIDAPSTNGTCYFSSNDKLCSDAYNLSESNSATSINLNSASTNSKSINFISQITIPGSSFIKNSSTTVTNDTGFLAKYIKAIYNYLLAIVGLLAAIVLMISGIVWLTAAGNTERISQAKNWMMGSFTGLILALSSFLLLKLINPNLVSFTPTNITSIGAIEEKDGCCQFTNEAKISGLNECYNELVAYGTISKPTDEILKQYNNDIEKYKLEKTKGNFYKGYSVNSTHSVCEKITEEQKIENDAQCAKKSFGERCADDDGTGEDKCWCYYGQVYKGRVGEINDWCGIAEGSICVESGTCNIDSIGGRNCKGTSDCCQKEGITSPTDYSICKDKVNGDRCIDTNDCWCYNSKPYTGDGKQGEHCGDEGGTCMFDDEDVNRCPGSFERDFGSRDCISNYYCCR
jgi:hypothetical protein